ncbi:MAG: NADH-quinone oxidoreductase subunit A [Desulfobacterales bacterium]|nr:NADH-quinone oxidoreductase subunit A [Desulfobacterales bacterium]
MILSWLHLAIILFFVAGLGFAGGPLILSLFVAPKAKGGDIGMPYECGIRPYGSSWMRFGINYYIYALLFLAFDVDVLYLYPVGAFYPDAAGLAAFAKVFVFLFVMALAVIYFWMKGVFTWPRRIS